MSVSKSCFYYDSVSHPGADKTLTHQLSTHITTQALEFRSSAEKMTLQKIKIKHSAEKVVRLKQFSAKKVVRPWPDRPPTTALHQVAYGLEGVWSLTSVGSTGVDGSGVVSAI